MQANTNHTTRRNFLTNTGAAMAVASAAALPVTAAANIAPAPQFGGIQPRRSVMPDASSLPALKTDANPLPDLWAKRQSLKAQHEKNWALFRSVRAETDRLYPDNTVLLRLPHSDLKITAEATESDILAYVVADEDHGLNGSRRQRKKLNQEALQARIGEVTAEFRAAQADFRQKREDHEHANGGVAAFDRADALHKQVIDIDDRIAATPIRCNTDFTIHVLMLRAWAHEAREDGYRDLENDIQPLADRLAVGVTVLTNA